MGGERGKQAKPLGALFDVYKKRLRAPQRSVVTAFQEVAEELLKVSIKEEDCEYTPGNRTLKVTAPGPVKNEILLRKKEILTHLKGRLGERSAPEELI